MVTLGNNPNKKEDQCNEIKKAREERGSCFNTLASAYTALRELQQELLNEEKTAEELRDEIDRLQCVIAQAEKDKLMLEDALRQQQEETNILQQRINLNLVINDKETSIRNNKASLAELEAECNNLTSIFNRTNEDLTEANSTVEGLKEQLNKIKEELELKKCLEKNLNNRIKLLVTETCEINKKVHVLHEEYNNLKSASAKRAAFEAQIMLNKDRELNQLKEKLENALKEISCKESFNEELIRERDNLRMKLETKESSVKKLTAKLQTTQETLEASRLDVADLSSKNSELNQLLANNDSKLNALKEQLENAWKEASSKQLLNEELTRERRFLRTMWEREANNVKNLMVELQTTQEALKVSTLDDADLSKQLDQSKRSNKELICKISRIQTDCEEEQKSLKRDLNEANWSLKLQSDKLVSVKEALQKTEQELHVKTNELKDAIETLENLKKDLLEVTKIAETTARDLKQERACIASLKEKFARERCSLRMMLEKEENSVKDLMVVLQTTQEALKASRLDAADFSKQLEQSKRSNKELVCKVSRIQTDCEEEQKSLKRDLSEANCSLKLQSDKLVSIKEALQKTEQELHARTDELKDAMETLENLKKDLQEVTKKAEATAHDLKKERTFIACLNEKFTRERRCLRTMFEKEVNSVKSLKAELQTTQEALKASRLDAADLSNQLDQSKRSNKELLCNISRIQTDCEEEQKSLKRDLSEANWSLKLQSDKLISVKEALQTTEQELHARTDELKDTMETLENLKKDLLEVTKIAETTASDLKQERTCIASLKEKFARERCSLKTMLEKEENSVKDLMVVLQTTQEALKASRLDAADFSKQLEQSKRSNKELICKVSRIQTDCEEEQKSLKHDLSEANCSLKLQSDKLVSIKEALQKTEQELHARTDELKDAMENLENLKTDLLEATKIAETTARDLKQERMCIASLKENFARERSSLRMMLEKEANSVRNLMAELQTTQEFLKAFRCETTDLSKQLDQSKRSNKELICKISRIQTDCEEEQKSLKRELSEANWSLKLQSDKLVSVKEALQKTEQELHARTEELTDAMETLENLKNDLLEVSKIAKTTARDLREKRMYPKTTTHTLEECCT